MRDARAWSSANMHEKITQFSLAEKGVQFSCNTSANYKMVSDWLKKQKKPTRTNQIRAVSTTKCKKMAPWFSAKNDLILHAKNRTF